MSDITSPFGSIAIDFGADGALPGGPAAAAAGPPGSAPSAPKSIAMPPKGEVMSDIGRAGLVLESAAGTRGTGPYASTIAIPPGSIREWRQPVPLTPAAAPGVPCGHPGGRACSSRQTQRPAAIQSDVRHVNRR